MKKPCVIAVSLLAAAAAFADDPTVVEDHAVYDRTRAEVAAEAVAWHEIATALNGEDSGSFAMARMQAHEAQPQYASASKPE